MRKEKDSFRVRQDYVFVYLELCASRAVNQKVDGGVDNHEKSRHGINLKKEKLFLSTYSFFPHLLEITDLKELETGNVLGLALNAMNDGLGVDNFVESETDSVKFDVNGKGDFYYN